MGGIGDMTRFHDCHQEEPRPIMGFASVVAPESP